LLFVRLCINTKLKKDDVCSTPPHEATPGPHSHSKEPWRRMALIRSCGWRLPACTTRAPPRGMFCPSSGHRRAVQKLSAAIARVGPGRGLRVDREARTASRSPGRESSPSGWNRCSDITACATPGPIHVSFCADCQRSPRVRSTPDSGSSCKGAACDVRAQRCSKAPAGLSRPGFSASHRFRSFQSAAFSAQPGPSIPTPGPCLQGSPCRRRSFWRDFSGTMSQSRPLASASHPHEHRQVPCRASHLSSGSDQRLGRDLTTWSGFDHLVGI
jgi:hypothetical protein